jgi:hypothetical protein
MKPLTIAALCTPGPFAEQTLRRLAMSPVVDLLLLAGGAPSDSNMPGARMIEGESLRSQRTLDIVLEAARTPYLLLLPDGSPESVEPGALERMIEVARSAEAGMLYSDYYATGESAKVLHPLCAYQPGSVRDDFDFGAMLLFSVSAARKARQKYGLVQGARFAGLYDLRLKVSIDRPVAHLPEALYSFTARPVGPAADLEHFAYLDIRNEAVQKEMEQVFTDYLKIIDAYVPGSGLRPFDAGRMSFPVEASVIIPVRDRKETIADAAASGLSQETDFPFNVIVVDNYSTDGTTSVLRRLGAENPALHRVVPARRGLAIGGCWNEALHYAACGRYAVQLDSDDLYRSPDVLQRIVDVFREGSYGVVIGAYTLVDFSLEEIPPGLIDHREWTDENGHNNALRVNGLGAPRAFATALARERGFPDVSYGEDYAVCLRICREYRIGRIYDSLYLCRRWPGNTDSGLDLDGTNRNNVFKDWVRTAEILARQKMNREGG